MFRIGDFVDCDQKQIDSLFKNEDEKKRTFSHITRLYAGNIGLNCEFRHGLWGFWGPTANHLISGAVSSMVKPNILELQTLLGQLKGDFAKCLWEGFFQNPGTLLFKEGKFSEGLAEFRDPDYKRNASKVIESYLLALISIITQELSFTSNITLLNSYIEAFFGIQRNKKVRFDNWNDDVNTREALSNYYFDALTGMPMMGIDDFLSTFVSSELAQNYDKDILAEYMQIDKVNHKVSLKRELRDSHIKLIKTSLKKNSLKTKLFMFRFVDDPEVNSLYESNILSIFGRDISYLRFPEVHTKLGREMRISFSEDKFLVEIVKMLTADPALFDQNTELVTPLLLLILMKLDFGLEYKNEIDTPLVESTEALLTVIKDKVEASLIKDFKAKLDLLLGKEIYEEKESLQEASERFKEKKNKKKLKKRSDKMKKAFEQKNKEFLKSVQNVSQSVVEQLRKEGDEEKPTCDYCLNAILPSEIGYRMGHAQYNNIVIWAKIRTLEDLLEEKRDLEQEEVDRINTTIARLKKDALYSTSMLFLETKDIIHEKCLASIGSKSSYIASEYICPKTTKSSNILFPLSLLPSPCACSSLPGRSFFEWLCEGVTSEEQSSSEREGGVGCLMFPAPLSPLLDPCASLSSSLLLSLSLVELNGIIWWWKNQYSLLWVVKIWHDNEQSQQQLQAAFKYALRDAVFACGLQDSEMARCDVDVDQAMARMAIATRGKEGAKIGVRFWYAVKVEQAKMRCKKESLEFDPKRREIKVFLEKALAVYATLDPNMFSGELNELKEEYLAEAMICGPREFTLLLKLLDIDHNYDYLGEFIEEFLGNESIMKIRMNYPEPLCSSFESIAFRYSRPLTFSLTGLETDGRRMKTKMIMMKCSYCNQKNTKNNIGICLICREPICRIRCESATGIDLYNNRPKQYRKLHSTCIQASCRDNLRFL